MNITEPMKMFARLRTSIIVKAEPRIPPRYNRERFFENNAAAVKQAKIAVAPRNAVTTIDGSRKRDCSTRGPTLCEGGWRVTMDGTQTLCAVST